MKLKFNLFKNQYKKTETQPVYKGQVKNEEGHHVGDVSCWVKKDKNGNDFLSCSIGKPYVKEEIQNPPDALFDSFNAASLDTDPDCPF